MPVEEAVAAPPLRAPDRRAVGAGVLFAGTLLLFLVWSNTFLAFEVLLAPAHGNAPMRWQDLAVARFVPVTVVCAVWCFGWKRRESLDVLRRHPVRLVASGLLVAPGYGGFMYYGISHRVSGPVASLLTTLTPLYLLALGALAFGERIGRRSWIGLTLGFAGVALVATARTGEVAPTDVFVLALAQVCWSVYSVLTKPMTKEVSPLVWTYLVLVVGGLPLLCLSPFVGGPAMLALDATGWALLLYLSLAATVLGNALWTWLLRHLPASTTGLTVFLNPPLTTASKWVLASVFPLAFAFSIRPQEWAGGALALTGVAIAVLRPPPHRAAAASATARSNAAGSSPNGPGSLR
jgi:O-acetylserine/cysteine efflux transporter